MDRETFGEEKSSFPASRGRTSKMQTSFIKSSLHIRDRSKASATEAVLDQTFLESKMVDEVPKLSEEEYSDILKDMEHPNTYVPFFFPSTSTWLPLGDHNGSIR